MKVIIAGGGIGGMSAALALLRAGHEVEVHEQAKALTEVGAGIQISPNGSRALDHLGVFEDLEKTSVTVARKEFRLWSSGKSWPLFDLGQQAVEKYGYPYLTVYRPDLLKALEDGVRALDPRAIRLSERVVGVEQDADSASVLLADGTRATGDVVIGADGWRSVVRTALWGEHSPEFSGMVAWRGLVPWEKLPAHMQEWVGSTWIGPGGHAVSYPLHGGEIMNFVATMEDRTWTAEGGSEPGTAEECHADFAGWHDDVHTLIDLSSSLSKWALVRWEPISQWSDGRISLLGDAAHATLPFLAQGAVHSIEDGVVLARALSEYGADPAEALKRYEAARIERTTKMVRGATANTGRFHAPELATAEGADAYMAREFSEAPIADRYDWLYAYDAVNAPI
jgi:salicylate hydroxylase